MLKQINPDYFLMLVTVQPPPLTPPTRGGRKTFSSPYPLTEGEKGGDQVGVPSCCHDN